MQKKYEGFVLFPRQTYFIKRVYNASISLEQMMAQIEASNFIKRGNCSIERTSEESARITINGQTYVAEQFKRSYEPSDDCEVRKRAVELRKDGKILIASFYWASALSKKMINDGTDCIMDCKEDTYLIANEMLADEVFEMLARENFKGRQIEGREIY
jgi:hypothetical protein